VKKNIMILIAMVLMLSITGCSNEKTTEKGTDSGEVNQQVEQSNTQAEETKETKENKLDSSITGLELLKSVQYKAPKSLIMEAEVTGFEGFVSKTITYNKGQNSRMETEGADVGKQIVIYNADEGATYQYKEGDAQGIVMLDGEDEDAMEMGMATPTFADLVDESSENIVARVEKLDGEEVIYIETKESEGAEGEATVYMWYSPKYSVPLKYEFHMNGKRMLSSVITKIEADVAVDDDYFTPPSDVKFMNYSLDDIFDGPKE
jgi:outer membrane lipoprotein-sorting protein/outer membrane murein-binding lipoprotein Lpp